jgi:hypothetical protein
MERNELAKTVEKLIRENTDLILTGNAPGTPTPEGFNVVYDLEGNPTIPIMEETDQGIRKRFTIVFQDVKGS